MLTELINNKELLFIILFLIVIILFTLIIFLVSLEKRKIKKKTYGSLESDLLKVLEQEEKTEIKRQENSVESKENELGLLLEKMQRDIEVKNEEIVKTFEEEQEEKSIISYQELLKAGKKEQLKEDIDLFNKELLKDEKVETKKFRNSEFISPIYGKLDNNVEYPKIPNFKNKEYTFQPTETETTEEKIPVIKKEVESTINLENLDNEIKKSEKFLETLKEFRRNLE